MELKLKLFATLRTDRFKERILEVREGTTPLELLQQFGIDQKEVAILLINGRDGLFDQELHAGDTVSVFPPVGGG